VQPFHRRPPAQHFQAAMMPSFRAICRRWVRLFGRRAGDTGVGDPLRPTVTPEGSVAPWPVSQSALGETLAPYLYPGYGRGFVFVPPTLVCGFREAVED